MENEYKLRYEGVRWSILYGSYEGAEKFALSELQRIVQNYMPYVINVQQVGHQSLIQKENLILLGTSTNNPWIDELSRKDLISLPSKPQGYSIACFNSPWCKDKRVVVITGYDSRGVLYGVEDFIARRLVTADVDNDSRLMRQAIDEMGDFSISEYPLIENRGIWTWGYVIYDYRRFIDNMARVKMNMLTIWNDCPPLNCREIIDYAHSRGVKVILGFHWGWGVEGLDPRNEEHRQCIKREVLAKYEKYYHHQGMDGIYFQTFTEQTKTEIGGRTIAALACEWVNDIAGAILDKYPDIYIQFGLHATSILENYPDLKPLDPRVTIVWEDAGVIPYAYDPVAKYSDEESRIAQGLNSAGETINYSKRLATFRGKSEFAMVPKGWISLRWVTEFEHHGSFILGERSREFIRNRLMERQPRWDNVNTLWLKNYPVALKFYREMIDCSPEKMTVTGLIEDGMFEETIQPSVSLFGEMVWNPGRDKDEILQLAMSPYYRKIQ